MEQTIALKNINRLKEGIGIKSLIKKIILAAAAMILLFAAIEVINASKHQMVVNVKEGENIMGINPSADSLDFGDLSRDNGMTRYINFKNGGDAPVYIAAVKFGEISDLVKTDPGSFVLKPGDEKKMGFEIRIPASAETRKYSGWVWIFRLPKIL